MVSRGRHSLQLVFVLTKAFIAKVQKLTSLTRQEGDKRGPREQKRFTDNAFSARLDTRTGPWKDESFIGTCTACFSHTLKTKTICTQYTVHHMSPVHIKLTVYCNVLGSCVCNVLQRGKHKQNINMKTIQDHMKIIPKGFFLEKKIIWIF